MSVNDNLSGNRIAVVGAGLVGCLIAVHLARRGARVDIYEKRPDLRRNDIPGGRTIVMSLSDRGWRALEAVDLADAVRDRTIPKTARCVHAPDGRIYVQPYGGPEDAIWTVDRKELNCLLLDAAEDAGATLRFRHACLDVDPDVPAIVVEDETDPGERTVPYDRIIGADGIFSRVREALVRRRLLGDEILTMDYGYRELSIPPGPDGNWVLTADQVHIWPTPDMLLVALPNRDRSFTCSLFYAKNGQYAFADASDPAAAAAVFAERFPSALRLIPDLGRELITNKPSDICAVRCDDWQHAGKVMLIGDAAHAIVPFMAMGMNTGFEDGTVFANLLDEEAGNLDEVFARFARERKSDADAIGDLSLRNFGRISESWEPAYHRRWELERAIWHLLPSSWTPSYALVAFSHVPLAEVVDIGRRQDAVLDRLLHEFPPDRELDTSRLETLVTRLLPATTDRSA